MRDGGVEEVRRLVAERLAARDRREFDRADALRRTLFVAHSVSVDDSGDWSAHPGLGGQDGGCFAWCRRRRVKPGDRPGYKCGRPVQAGGWFCALHAPANRGKVPCPTDPRHAVPLAKLHGHLKVCSGGVPSHSQAAVVEGPHLTAGRNSGGSGGQREPEESRLLPAEAGPAAVAAAEADEALLGRLQARVIAALASLRACDGCADAVPAASVCEAVRLKPLNRRHPEPAPSACSKRRRDAVQQGALAALASEGLVAPAAVVEFCAGTAGLSQALGRLWPEAALVAVDKAQFRGVHSGAVRVTADIRDLELSGVAELCDADRFVAVGKHLCGSAADLALRCVVSTERPAAVRVAIALCCHHLCDWGNCGPRLAR